jgi:hypothetical protein
MRILIAIIATISILVQTWDKLAIVAAYELQRDYIASNLCENKAMPELHCEGTCVLSKKLSEDTSDEGQPEPLRFNEREPLPIIYQNTHLTAHAASGFSRPEFNRCELPPTSGHLSSVFRPPTV